MDNFSNIFTARLATTEDIVHVVKLNEEWYKPNVSDLSKGFLSVLYTKEMLASIVEVEELFVFELRNNIFGYCLVNTQIEPERMKKVKQFYYSKFPERVNNNVAFSYMILLNHEAQGKGLFQIVLNKCLPVFKSKYQFIVSTISKGNTKSIAAHKKYGWSFKCENEDYYIIEY